MPAIIASVRGTSTKNQLGEVEPLYQCAGDCGVSLHLPYLAINYGPLSKLLAIGSRWFCKNCRTCSAVPPCSVTGRVSIYLHFR